MPEKFDGANKNNIYKEQVDKKRNREYIRNLKTHRPSPENAKHIAELKKDVDRISEKHEGFIEKHSGLTGAKEFFEKQKEDFRNKYREALWSITVSITDIIPDINVDGLQLKQKPDDDKTRGRITDEDPERDLKWLSSKLSTPFADFLYIGGSEEDVQKYRNKNNGKEIDGLLEVRKELRQAFAGQIVVDIAAGSNSGGYRIADQADAKAYVAVEPVFQTQLFYTLFQQFHPEFDAGTTFWSFKEKDKKDQESKREAPIAIVGEDMLSFLKRLPDNSVSIWCSGIDFIVIPDRDYRASVAKEIVRVLHPDGAYVGQAGMSIGIPENEAVSQNIVGVKEKNFYGEGESFDRMRSVKIYKKNKS